MHYIIGTVQTPYNRQVVDLVVAVLVVVCRRDESLGIVCLCALTDVGFYRNFPTTAIWIPRLKIKKTKGRILQGFSYYGL